MPYPITFKPFGESAILIEWPSKIDEEIIQDIISFERIVGKQQRVIDTIIAYNSLTVILNNWDNYRQDFKYRKRYQNTVEKLQNLYNSEREHFKQKSRIWNIPVCYDSEFGIDLQEVSKAKSLSPEEIIRLHTEPIYSVYFIGFLPGFLYLGGLNSKIHIPRKNTPRLRVEKGSVAIGGEQTGIYPQDSAGGWNIVGRSPVDFFDITKNQPCFVKAGDKVKFISIDQKTFQEVSEKSSKGNYSPKFSWL